MFVKYRDFMLVERRGTGPANWKFKAHVTEVRGLVFKSTRTRQVVKSYAGSWIFSDSGKWAPSEVDDLCRMVESQRMQELHEMYVNNPSL